MVSFPEYNVAKPFLKWAGGKSQLIPAIEASLPLKTLAMQDITYVEPFIGSGAIFFWVLNKFPNIKRLIINDINADLINSYRVIKDNPDTLIKELRVLEKKYKSFQSEDEKRDFFLSIRALYNSKKLDNIQNASFLIFLNRTCFNGLYRVNSKNEFNVPFGKYSNPKICDASNIQSISYLLQKVIIMNGDYEQTLNYVSGKSFFYFDPPYRPLTKTAAFNSYSSASFNDNEQVRLLDFCKLLNAQNHLWLLSNSDPQNIDESDNFFDDLYSDFFIKRINAKRLINSDSLKRGEIKELLISNYVINNLEI